MSDSHPRSERARRPRWLLGALVALIPIVPIVVALLITGSSTAPTATARGESAAATSAPRNGSAARSTPASSLPAGRGALVGFLTRPQAIRSSPGGARLATLATKTSYGSPTSVLVRRVRGRWLGVVSVAAGNNRLGWITRSHVALTRVAWTLHTYLARHELVVDHDGRAVRHYAVADGMPTAPTPPGLYAVTDRLTTGQPAGPYGCCILALSAKAPHAISDWAGGNRIAVHATPAVSSIGESVSHGCIHVTDAEGRWLLSHIPLGTPVVISSA